MENSSHSSNNIIVDLNFLQLIKYFYSQRIILLIFVAALPAFSGLYLFFFKKPMYSSSVKIVVNTNSKANAIDDRMAYYFSQEQQAISKISQVEDFVNSRLFLDQLKSFFKDKSLIVSKYPEIQEHLLETERYIKGYSTSQKITPDVKAGMIFSRIGFGSDLEKRSLFISVSSRVPKASAAMANVASFVLLNYNHDEMLKEETSVINFLKEQTDRLENQLLNLEEEYVNLQKKYNIFSEEVAKNQMNLIHIAHTKELSEINKKVEVHRKVYNSLKDQLRSVHNQVGVNNNSSFLYLKQLQKRLDLLNYQSSIKNARGLASESEKENIKLKIANIIERYKLKVTKSKPYLTINPLENITSLEKKIKEVDDKLFQLQARKNAQMKVIDASADRIKNLPKATQELMSIKRRIDLTANLFRELVIKLQETKVREAGYVNDLKVITYAEANGRPAGMGVKKSFILSSLVGLALGLMLLLLRFVLIPTVRDQLDLEKIGIKVIGNLPFYRSKRKTVLSMGSSPSVILEDESIGYEANLIRKTRFLLQKEMNKINKMYTGNSSATLISICSANANEGKTFFSSNLALSLSKTEQRTLLVDLDFLKPDVQDYFRGIKDIEENMKYDLGGIELRTRNVNEFFDILDAPSTTDNVADKLQGPQFRKLLVELGKKYDVILFDTPAANGFLEPMIIAQYCELLVMVVNQRMTLIEDVRRTIQKINDGDVSNILGVINFNYDDYKANNKMVKAS